MRKMYLIVLSVFVAMVFSVSTASAAAVYLWPHGKPGPTPGDISVVIEPSQFGSTLVLDTYLHFTADEDPSEKGPFAATYRVNYDPDTCIKASFGSVNTDRWSIPEGSKVEVHPEINEVHVWGYDYYDGEQLPYGEYLIGTITFDIAGSPLLGTTTLMTADWSAMDGDFLNWAGTGFDDKVTFYGGTATCVPIPTTLLLLGSGLVGLIGLRRKIRS